MLHSWVLMGEAWYLMGEAGKATQEGQPPTQSSRSQTEPATGQESPLQPDTRGRGIACHVDFAFPPVLFLICSPPVMSEVL